ncbi:hypothetical protein [Burkholderia singularis]|uniref:hypothetical protein n=1 Tax=Burkholderia singularis TaxID=1503053 RepID=UPI000A7C24FA|nr:hypothetical protein [Burkholderia singularis]
MLIPQSSSICSSILINQVAINIEPEANTGAADECASATTAAQPGSPRAIGAVAKASPSQAHPLPSEPGILQRLKDIGPCNIAKAAVASGLRDGTSSFVGRYVGDQASNLTGLLLSSTNSAPVANVMAAVAGAASVGTGALYGYSMGKLLGNSLSSAVDWAKQLNPSDYGRIAPLASGAKAVAPYMQKLAYYTKEIAPSLCAFAGAGIGGAGYALAGPTVAVGNLVSACTRSFMQQRVTAPYGSNIQWENGIPKSLYVLPPAIGYAGIAIGSAFASRVATTTASNSQLEPGICQIELGEKFHSFINANPIPAPCSYLLSGELKSTDNPFDASTCAQIIGNRFKSYVSPLSPQTSTPTGCEDYFLKNAVSYVNAKFGMVSNFVRWAFKPLIDGSITGIGEAVDGAVGTVFRAAAHGSRFEPSHPISHKYSNVSFRKEATSRICSATAGQFINGISNQTLSPPAVVVGQAVTGFVQEYRSVVTRPVVTHTNEYFHGWFSKRAPIDVNTMANTDDQTETADEQTDDEA